MIRQMFLPEDSLMLSRAQQNRARCRRRPRRDEAICSISRWRSGGRTPRATDAADRRAVVVVEMMVCSVLLAVVTLILVPGLQAVGKQRQAIRFETLAMIELNNRHQELLHSGPEPLDIASLQLSPWFQRRYPGASLQAEMLPVTESPAEPPAATDSAVDTATEPDLLLTAIRLTVRRSAGTGPPDGSASLVVWLPHPAGSESLKNADDGVTTR